MPNQPSVVEATICHIIDGDRLLLKKATRGISKGKWNGPGGKIDIAETPEQNVYREVLEETGLELSDLFYHGKLHFFLNGNEQLDVLVHLFSTKNFKGSVQSTEEGEVRWFRLGEIPLEQMWDDDNYWLAPMLDNKHFDGYFYMDDDNAKVRKYALFYW